MQVAVRGYSFESEVTSEEVSTAEKVLGFGIPSDTLHKEMQKKIAARALVGSEPAVIENVQQEIDAAPPESQRQEEERQREEDLLMRRYQGAE